MKVFAGHCRVLGILVKKSYSKHGQSQCYTRTGNRTGEGSDVPPGRLHQILRAPWWYTPSSFGGGDGYLTANYSNDYSIDIISSDTIDDGDASGGE